MPTQKFYSVRGADNICKNTFSKYLSDSAIYALLFIVWDCHAIDGATITICKA